jgi:outer membrane lipoprotein-sorting protein
MSSPESKPETDQELEVLLTETFGPPPRADIDAWRKRYPSALAWLNPQRISVLYRRRKRMQRIIILAATMAAAVCVWLGVSNFDTSGPGISAFAQTVAQIQKAKDITWTTTIYERITSKDGQRHWYRTNLRKLAYRAPGLYRETAFDEKGNVEFVEITDAVNKKVLTLYPSAKIATIAEIRPAHDPEGPFLDAQRALKDFDLQFIERRKTATGDVNVFRHVAGHCFFDCWIDQKSKQLVEYRINQGKHVTLADYENDPSRNAKPEIEFSVGTIVGSITKDIVYNADLDASLFQFDVPKDYTTQLQKRHLVTEQEMIDYFRILVDFTDKVFPGDLSHPDSDQLNKYRKMPRTERPHQAQKLIETVDYYGQIHSRALPLREFLADNADWNSFRYLGEGVKLGDKAAIVCWYKLKDAKDPNVYRVIYGDLSVKDVAAKDLPLPVEP